jgi:tetratricopeptide (TPR) repeat protein
MAQAIAIRATTSTQPSRDAIVRRMRAAVHLTVSLIATSMVTHADVASAHGDHPLGVVVFPTSCSDEAAPEFNHAVALLHHMTYPQAREGFERVAAIDPQCAMAHWGIAMTLFQPLWPTRPGPQALQRGWDEVQKAKSLRPQTQREQLFIAEAEAFFLEPASSDYWLRIRRWEQAAQKVYEAFPGDDEAAAFYALAILATAPSDRITRDHSDRAAAILMRVYEHNPDHPGAMHYLIHANDVPGREHELLDVTHKYEAAAPDNPHALHMPTHIYTRLGEWDSVIRGNLRAADAALKTPAGGGQYVWDEFPHAIEYLVYAYLQQGADDEAAKQLERLSKTANLEPTFKTAFHLASTQARFALERHAWEEAAAIVPREPATLDWDRFAWAEAIAWFARGMGAARLGRLDEAEAAGGHIKALEAATGKTGEDLFARNIGVLRRELNAWLMLAQDQGDASVELMREAAELEASTPKHPVTPGPTLPADEQLGDLYMELKRPADALASYERSMTLYPKRFNGLLGAARASRSTGDESATHTYYQQLLDLAGQGTRQASLEEARREMAGRQR